MIYAPERNIRFILGTGVRRMSGQLYLSIIDNVLFYPFNIL